MRRVSWKAQTLARCKPSMKPLFLYPSKSHQFTILCSTVAQAINTMPHRRRHMPAQMLLNLLSQYQYQIMTCNHQMRRPSTSG